MESIKLLVQTDHKFLTWVSIFCRCVTNVKTLIVTCCGRLPTCHGVEMLNLPAGAVGVERGVTFIASSVLPIRTLHLIHVPVYPIASSDMFVWCWWFSLWW